MNIKKIVVIGPESTGKSTLCKQLAGHYNTVWCPEYAREYLEKNGSNYNYDNLLTIAKGQIELEEKSVASCQLSEKSSPLTSHNSHLFIDTNMYVMKVWSEFVFGKCHSWVLDKIANRNYDLYLLCNTDLPWVKDELREYPDVETRNKLYHFYKDAMINQSVPWIDISGNYEQRLTTAIGAINLLMK
jgi:NadR type nicotinamide-nucleotide adenylyltransferase